MRRFSDMNEEAFQQVIDSYIDRAAAGGADVPADVFFDLLAERISNEADQTVNLSVDIVENGIEIRPDQESSD